MDLVALLSVLAISYTVVLARSLDMDQTKTFKFPTTLRRGYNVTINGTMDTTKYNKLEVVFPSINGQEEKHCKLKYHTEDNKLYIAPTEAETGIESAEYEITGELDNPSNLPTFSIKLKTMEKNMFQFSFEANGSGVMQLGSCLVDSYEDIEHIEFRQGLHTLTSFFVEFL